MRIRRLYTGNVVYGRLPRGCKLCLRGFKSVVFITGVCPEDCFYCPVSGERRGKDLFFVNERPVRDLRDVVAEVASSGSRGAGITGGEPLSRLNRTAVVMKMLKETFGEGFHIHLYTSGVNLTREALRELESAGLDELRVHPDLASLESSLEVFELLERYKPKFEIGLEVPVLPGEHSLILQLVSEVSKFKIVKFIILNELEFSESNYAKLRGRGYAVSEDGKAALGSREAAEEALSEALKLRVDLSVHFCPVSSKDSYQTRLRMYRRGALTARPHELVSNEGTLLKAVISEGCARLPSMVMSRGALGFEAPLIVAEGLGVEYRLVEELPNYNRTLLNVM